MKFGIIACGSRGDIQPFLALAVALKQKGHEVKFISSENFQSFIENYQIEFIPYATHAMELIHSEKLISSLQNKNELGVVTQLFKLGQLTIKEFNKIPFQAFEEFDFLISHVFLSAFVLSIAERLNKKFGVVILNIPGTPTIEFPYQPLGFFNHPWYNRFSYKVIKLIWLVYKKQINQHRQAIGLKPVDMWRKVFKENILTIYPMSHVLLRQPTDWPSNTHVTGFFQLPVKHTITGYYDPLPDGFDLWLSEGEKPIFIGFGSIPIPDEDLIYKLIDKLILANYRLVFVLAWSEMKQLPSHPNLKVLKSVNYDWLLPQCKLAIFPAGIGTISSALRAGIPMVLLSILADQPYNGKMAQDKKVAIHIPFNRSTLQKLLDAIGKCLKPSFADYVKTLGSTVRQEKGVEDAVSLIENYAGLSNVESDHQ